MPPAPMGESMSQEPSLVPFSNAMARLYLERFTAPVDYLLGAGDRKQGPWGKEPAGRGVANRFSTEKGE